ncbi:MAG: hypothetical protein FVQ82_15110 [Planctomycetes bacterium]|nr:hypothetical protein [Planctomycetota bacterium]
MMLKTQNCISRLLWVFVPAGLLLCGCAADKAYDEGVRLLERGNYGSAVTKLKHSVRLAEGDKFIDDLDEPCCGREYTLPGQPAPKPVEEKSKWPWESKKKLSKYRQKLKEAKRRGGKYHYRQGQNFLAITDLGTARSHLLKSLEYDQSVFEYHDLLRVIIASTGKAEDMRKQALALAELKNWPEAVKKMQKALAAYKSMPRGKQTLDKIKRDAYDYHYQLAYDFLAKDDRDDAGAQARQALVYVANGHGARNILTKIANRNKADGLILTAEKLLAMGQCEQALSMLQHAYKLYPSMPNIMTLIKNAKVAVCDKIIASGNEYLRTGRYEQALRCFRRSGRMLNGYKNIDVLIERASYELADGHHKKAGSFVRRQLFANAILYDVLSLGYRPENYAAKQQLMDNKKKIQKDINYVMGFVGFKSSQKNRELTNTLEAAAVQHLSRVKPPNVLFMDRMDLASVMEELNLNITDMVDPEFRIESGKLKGIDALVIGHMLENKVLTTSKTTYRKTEYQSGTKMIANPKYQPVERVYKTAMYNLRRAELRLADARANLRACRHDHEDDKYSAAEQAIRLIAVNKARKNVAAAESKAHIAQNRLNMTPQQISVPRILPHTYPVQYITMTSKISLSIKVLDTMTGSIIFTDRIVGKYAESDNFVKGDSVRNVVADPLDLPDDAAMADKAMEKVIVKMNSSLELASKKHGQRFVANMRQAEKIGDSERAVENCIRYLFAYPVGSDHTNKMISYLESLISAEKDLVDLNKLLQRHCHVLLRQAEFPANLKNSNDRVVITRLKTKVSEQIKLPCTLIAIDGRPIGSIKEVDAIMTQYGVGDRISITVMSNNRNISAEIELARARY